MAIAIVRDAIYCSMGVLGVIMGANGVYAADQGIAGLCMGYAEVLAGCLLLIYAIFRYNKDYDRYENYLAICKEKDELAERRIRNAIEEMQQEAAFFEKYDEASEAFELGHASSGSVVKITGKINNK